MKKKFAVIVIVVIGLILVYSSVFAGDCGPDGSKEGCGLTPNPTPTPVPTSPNPYPSPETKTNFDIISWLRGLWFSVFPTPE